MDEFFVDPTLYVGRAGDRSEIGAKQRAIYDILDALEISYFRADHEHADTIADCAAIEEILGAKICKNLFLRNRQATEFYLLLMPGDKPFRTAVVSKLLGVARLSFAEPEYLEQYLDLTPGSVTVLGLAKDPEHKVQLLIDRDVADEEWLGCHPCLNTSTIRLRTADVFEKFLKHTGHEAKILEIPYPEA